MEGLSTVFLKDILIESKDGEWGKEHFDPDYIKMFVIRGTDFSSVRYGNIDKVPCRYIRKNIAIRKKLQCDDILIETAGGTKDQPTGRSLFLKKHILDREIDFTCASFSRFLRIDPQRAFPEFIFWYLQYLYTYGYMYPYHVQHTGVARFQYTQFASQMIFQLPSYVEQQGIAHILGTLDDKIELNRRQNATLEAMAQAIFKEWFVDFGPVRAKMEGRQPEGMSREIADLFPERLDGEGKPEGWKKLTVGDVFKIAGGSTPSTKEEKFWQGGAHCWATPKDISRLKAPVLLETERHITNEGVSIISSGLLPVGTLLLSSRAPIGYLAITKVNTAINQGFIAVYENKKISSCYMLLWCKAHMNDIFEKANGSTFQEISKSNFRTISFIFPNDEILSIGNKYIKTIYEKITFNEIEINTLTSLRDSLLPKLISGELRVPDAEKMVAGIV